MERTESPAPEALRQAGGAEPTLSILVAEDDPTNQRLMQYLLRSMGHRVELVATGEQAVEAIRKARYDVVLMDLRMPGIGGLEATRRILAERSDGGRPRIVALTADVTQEVRHACREIGMDAYLSKPVLKEDLRRALGR